MDAAAMSRYLGHSLREWEAVESTLGPYLWPLLQRQVAEIAVKVGVSPLTVAEALASDLRSLVE